MLNYIMPLITSFLRLPHSSPIEEGEYNEDKRKLFSRKEQESLHSREWYHIWTVAVNYVDAFIRLHSVR